MCFIEPMDGALMPLSFQKDNTDMYLKLDHLSNCNNHQP